MELQNNLPISRSINTSKVIKKPISIKEDVEAPSQHFSIPASVDLSLADRLQIFHSMSNALYHMCPSALPTHWTAGKKQESSPLTSTESLAKFDIPNCRPNLQHNGFSGPLQLAWLRVFLQERSLNIVLSIFKNPVLRTTMPVYHRALF